MRPGKSAGMPGNGKQGGVRREEAGPGERCRDVRETAVIRREPAV